MLQLISLEIEGLDLERFMREALLEADAAGQAGEIAIGAVLVIDGEVVARGRARHKASQSQLSHAEMNALAAGGVRLWTDCRRAVLFTTVEPCPMCLGAVVMADVPHIIYALNDQVVHSKATLEANPYVRRHLKSYFGGVLETETVRLMEKHSPKDLHYIRTGKN